MSMSEREQIPEPTKRQVRQEAGFGCAKCGIPIISYNHIVPYVETHDNSPDNIIPLCPNHHRLYHAGQYSRETLRRMKAHPHNVEHVSHRFSFESPQLVMKAGTNTYIDTPIILEIDGEQLLSMRMEDGLIFINALFFSPDNQELVSIVDNEWRLKVEDVWDVEYSLGRDITRLTIRLEPRNILVQLELARSEIRLRAEMYYNGVRYSIRDSGTYINDQFNIAQVTNSTFERCARAFSHSTGPPGRDLPVLSSTTMSTIFREIDGSLLNISLRYKIRKLKNPDGSWKRRPDGSQEYFIHIQPAIEKI